MITPNFDNSKEGKITDPYKHVRATCMVLIRALASKTPEIALEVFSALHVLFANCSMAKEIFEEMSGEEALAAWLDHPN